jgi:hypothetical protein
MYFLLFQIGSLENHYEFIHHDIEKRSIISSHHHHQALVTHPEVSSLKTISYFRKAQVFILILGGDCSHKIRPKGMKGASHSFQSGSNSASAIIAIAFST